MNKADLDCSLYLVIGSQDCQHHSLLDTVRLAVAGGVSMVQLREKNISEREYTASAEALQNLLQPIQVPLIINDNIRVARAVGAAGVHLGQDDAHPTAARAQLGEDAIIGLSVSSPGQLARLSHDVDYLGIGPIFPTISKADAADAIGIEQLNMFSKELNWPIVAIGGINLDNIAKVVATSLCGVAVVSAIAGHVDPYLASQQLAGQLQKYLVR